ncbi:type II CAAX prenyl endopeptidase Rce1 family protein [Pediococcus acidilactici]|nr:CPBP family glutamic-type intramembrane protease [Pediococcus acidilactici]
MFILSSVLFGLIHWNNFNGDLLQMIPYMFVGAGFAVIYYKS